MSKAMKFALLADLGNVAVPSDFSVDDGYTEFFGLSGLDLPTGWCGLTEGNFPRPSGRITPGTEFRVAVYQQIVAGGTTGEDHLHFIKEQGGVLLGIHGIRIAFVRRWQFPRNRWIASFDEKASLHQACPVSDKLVPCISTHGKQGFFFNCGCFGSPWMSGTIFLCFRPAVSPVD